MDGDDGTMTALLPQVTATTTLEPLLLDARAAAALCGIGRSLWLELHASGRCPLPIRLGRRVVWRREELEAWVRAGCPARERWQETWKKSFAFAHNVK